jgi:hypothetical protein
MCPAEQKSCGSHSAGPYGSLQWLQEWAANGLSSKKMLDFQQKEHGQFFYH